jgi:acetolactate decarboxylase
VIPVLAAAVFVAVPTPAGSDDDRDVLYQVSTLGALQVGLLQPAASLRDLQEHGDFGLGTFVGLDGEMVVDRGTIFQVPFSGKARVAPASWETPFAAVTFFDADKKFTVTRRVDTTGLGRAIDRRLPTTNIFYAVRVTGEFAYLQTRSVPAQTPPYAPLADVVAKQRTFDLRKVRGTMVGLRAPEYVGSLNVPGYHWHFITKDRKAGGHVLAVEAKNVTVAVDATRTWRIQLPDTPAFDRADLPEAS